MVIKGIIFILKSFFIGIAKFIDYFFILNISEHYKMKKLHARLHKKPYDNEVV
jgi:hypothetical protein